MRESFCRLRETEVSPEQRSAAALDSMTLKAFYENELGLPPEVSRYCDPVMASIVGLGCDGVSAYFGRYFQFPGFLRLERYTEPPLMSFPGGNAAIARHFVARMIPAAFAGAGTREILLSPLRFDELDRQGNPVRLRLGSTAVRVEHETDAGVLVTFVRDGGPYRTHAAAIWSGGFGFSCNIRRPMVVGGQAEPCDPDEPIVMTFYAPLFEPGLPAHEQGAAARMQMLRTSFRDHERQIEVLQEPSGRSPTSERRGEWILWRRAGVRRPAPASEALERTPPGVTILASRRRTSQWCRLARVRKGRNRDRGHTGSERIVIYPSRARLALTLLGALALVPLCAWIGTLEVADWEHPWMLAVASYVGIPFFGTVAVYALYRLLHRKPALAIDATGITDAATAVGAGHLTWEEIASVAPFEYRGNLFLGIVPADLGALLRRRSLFLRASMKLNMLLGLPPVNIPQAFLPMTAEDLAVLLQTKYGARIGADA